MISSARTHPTSRSRGAALVEMSIVILLLFTLILGIMAYGYMMSFRQALTQAAAEGARAGALAPTGAELANAESAVNRALAGYGMDCPIGNPACDPCEAEGMTCTIGGPAPCANNATRSCITVTLRYDYETYPLLPSPPGMGFIFGTLGFTSVAESSP